MNPSGMERKLTFECFSRGTNRNFAVPEDAVVVRQGVTFPVAFPDTFHNGRVRRPGILLKVVEATMNLTRNDV